MNPELRAVYREIQGRVQKIWRLVRKPVGYLAAGGSSLALACATQPTPEQVQRPQEPQLPKDPITIQVTNTPIPVQELPTATATATPRPVEPTATPIREVARFLQQTPVYGIYTGENITEAGGAGVIGESLFSRLPDDRVLGAITRFKPCPDGTPITSIFLVSPNFIRGVGFGFEGPTESLTVGLSSPEFISGVLTIKDHERPGATCIGNKNLSIGARLLPERGKDTLLKKLTAMLQKADSRMTLTGVTSIVTKSYGRDLPEEPAK